MGSARRLLGIVPAAVAVAGSLLLVSASPAAADTAIEVEAGYVDGQIVPGRPIPVRVEVRADQLVTGTLTATPYALSQAGEQVTVPVEVAGGSVKDYLIVVPTRWSGVVGPSEMRVTLRTDDGEVESSTTLAWSDAVEVVGLLPGLASQVPEPVPLRMGLGRAVFTQLDAQALATPGALGPLGSVVAGPGGLGELPPAAQRGVLEWVEAGGQLLVDAAPGAAVAGVPEDWQPSGDRAPAGAGWVRLTAGSAARGQWARIIEPTRQFGPLHLGAEAVCCPSSVPDSVARDAGLRIPDVGWLLAFLVAYVVIVGPLTFVVVRRLRRTTTAWVAVPLVAVLFTCVAFTAGSSLRSDARAAHGTLVQASPLGDRVTSYVGLVSRDGGDPTALFPEGWEAGGLDAAALLGSPEVFVDGLGPRRRDVGRAEAVTADDGRPGVRLALSAGDFGMVVGRGRVDEPSPLGVTATAAADGTVTGTVTNGSDADLEAVIVVVGGRVADVGTVRAGETADWTVDTAAAGVGDNDPWAPIERPWDEAIGFDMPPDPDSVVNYSLYSTEVAADVDAYPPGIAVAAGWTEHWSPPVEVGSGLAGGRTGIVARAPVLAAPGTVPAASVRRELVRSPVSVTFDPPIQIADWGDAIGAVARFTLPEGADPATPLALDASGGVARAEVWNGRHWVALELAEGAVPAPGGPAPPRGPAPGGPIGPGDPFGPARQAQLPPGVVHDGCVYVRVAVTSEAASRMTLQVRGLA